MDNFWTLWYLCCRIFSEISSSHYGEYEDYGLMEWLEGVCILKLEFFLRKDCTWLLYDWCTSTKYTADYWFSGYVHLIMKPAAAGCMRIVGLNNSRDLCHQNKKYKILRVKYFALVPSLNVRVNYFQWMTF